MLGAIAGDIIGSVYEHNPIKTTEFPLFTFGSRFTDDTVLTVAVADALLNRKPYAKVFEDWYYRHPQAGYGSSFAKWASGHDHKPYNSFGNGSAMRVAPVGYAFPDLESTLAEARRSAEVTHNHPEGIKGAQAVAAAVFLARTGHSKQAIATAIAERFGYDISEPIDSVRKWYAFDVTCQGTVPHAIRAFLDSSDYESAVRLAVSLGGDADTLACITGAIAEAHYGFPAALVSEVERRLTGEICRVVDAFRALTK